MSNWNFFRLRMNINGSSTPAAWSIEDITAGTSADITSLINGSTSAGQTQPMVDPSGTRVYVPEFDNKKIRQLSLSSANDLTSTISNVGVSSALSYSFTNFQMSRNGNSAFLINYAGNKINQYNLSTAWDITTMSTTVASSISFSNPSGNWVERGLHFNTDGTEVYHLMRSFGATPFALKVQKYVLSTAYDLSTASTVDVIDVTTSYDPDGDEGQANNIIIIDDLCDNKNDNDKNDYKNSNDSNDDDDNYNDDNDNDNNNNLEIFALNKTVNIIRFPHILFTMNIY